MGNSGELANVGEGLTFEYGSKGEVELFQSMSTGPGPRGLN